MTKPASAPFLRDLHAAVDYRVAINRIVRMVPPLGRMDYSEWFWFYAHRRLVDRDPDFDPEDNMNDPAIEAKYPEYFYVTDTVRKIGHRVRAIPPSVGWSYDMVGADKFLAASTLSVHTNNNNSEGEFVQCSLKDLDDDRLLDMYTHIGHPVVVECATDLQMDRVDPCRLREITKFGVSDTIVEAVEAFWTKTFGFAQIKASPKRIALYGKDDFSNSHLTMPKKGVMGTVLFGISNSPPPAKICVDQMLWTSKRGSMCGFYTNVEYSVYSPVATPCSGFIEFEMYAVCTSLSARIYETPGNPVLDLIRSVAKSYRMAAAAVAPAIAWIVQGCPFQPDREALMAQDRNDEDASCIEAFRKLDPDTVQVGRPFGWLLSHGYSLLEEDLRGQDRVFIQAIRRFPNVTYTIIPVLRHFHAFEGKASYTDYLTKQLIYPITPAHINFVMNRGGHPTSVEWPPRFLTPRAVSTETLSFWAPDSINDFCWEMEINGTLEHDSMYVSRAIVVTSWGTAVPKDVVGQDEPPRKRPRLETTTPTAT